MPTPFIPNSKIILLENVPLGNDGKNFVTFANATEQATAFQQFAKFPMESGFSYVRDGESNFVLRVEIPYNQLVGVNMLMWQNSQYSQKWFYGFITKIEYVNDAVSWIYFEDDYYSTWQFDFDIDNCWVEREHANTDVAGDNVEPEPISYDRDVLQNSVSVKMDAVYPVAILSGTGREEEQGIIETITGNEKLSQCMLVSLKSTIPSPYDANVELKNILCFPVNASHVEPIGSQKIDYKQQLKLEKQIIDGCPFNGYLYLLNEAYLYNPDAEDFTPVIFTDPADMARIASAWLGGNFVSLWDGSVIPLQIENGIGEPVSSYVFSAFYVPKIVYDRITRVSETIDFTKIDDLKNPTDYSTYQFERPQPLRKDGSHVKNNKLKTFPFCKYVANYPSGNIVLRPEMFSGNEHTISYSMRFSMSPTLYFYPKNYRGYDYDFTNQFIINNFPKMATTSDNYQSWSGQQQSGLVSSIISVAGNLLAENYAGAVATGVNYIAGQATETGSPTIKPGTPATNNDMQTRFSGIEMQTIVPTPELVDVIDDYFTKYGYATNRLKNPNITGRKYWNYVKCSEAHVHGSVPLSASQAMENALNNGCTFWHGFKDGGTQIVGNYSLNNTIL